VSKSMSWFVTFKGVELCHNSPPGAVNTCVTFQFEDAFGNPHGYGFGFYPGEAIEESIKKLKKMLELMEKESAQGPATPFPVKSMTMTAPAVSEIEQACIAAVDYARRHECSVRFKFNGVWVFARRMDDPAQLADKQQRRQAILRGHK